MQIRASNPSIVLLAGTSPLYAPIYLAHAIDENWKDVRLEIAQPPHLGIDRNEPESAFKDPLPNQVLSEFDHEREILLGIGDPMRLVWPRPEATAEPLVVGSMIKRMCYWVIDGKEAEDSRADYWTQVRELITHPLGMTGFAVPFFHITEQMRREGKSKEAAEKDALELLLPKSWPGNEREVYDALVAGRKISEPHGGLYGFITTNPLEAMVARNHKSGETKLLKNYLGDDAFNDVVMTGLIARKDWWEAGGRQREKINQLCTGLGRALSIIFDDQYSAATMLVGSADMDPDSPFRDWTLREVKKFLEILVGGQPGTGAYNPSLAITQEQWDNSKAILSPTLSLISRAHPELVPVSLDGFDDQYFVESESSKESSAARAPGTSEIVFGLFDDYRAAAQDQQGSLRMEKEKLGLWKRSIFILKSIILAMAGLFLVPVLAARGNYEVVKETLGLIGISPPAEMHFLFISFGLVTTLIVFVPAVTGTFWVKSMKDWDWREPLLFVASLGLALAALSGLNGLYAGLALGVGMVGIWVTILSARRNR